MKFSPDHPSHLVLGLIIWSVWFIAIYGGLSLACDALSLPTSTTPDRINFLLFAVTCMTTVTLTALGVWCWRYSNTTHPDPQKLEDHGHPDGTGLVKTAQGSNPSRSRFFFAPRIAAGVYFFAAVATLGVGAPLLTLPPCL